MPQVNPIIPGDVTARKLKTNSGVSMTKTVALNGTTAVNVFGATNGINGTAYVMKVYSGSTDYGTVTLESGGAVAATIVRGSAGLPVCVDLNSLAFTAGGTMGVKSDLATDHAVVELTFV